MLYGGLCVTFVAATSFEEPIPQKSISAFAGNRIFYLGYIFREQRLPRKGLAICVLMARATAAVALEPPAELHGSELDGIRGDQGRRREESSTIDGVDQFPRQEQGITYVVVVVFGREAADLGAFALSHFCTQSGRKTR